MSFAQILKLIDPIKKLISDTFFEGQEPTWLSPLINYILLGILILLSIWGLLVLLSKIKKVWIEEFWPLFYKPQQKNILSELARITETSLFLDTQEFNRTKRLNKIIRRKRQKLLKGCLKNPSNLIKLLVSLFKGSKRSKHTPIERMIETYSDSEFLTNWLKQYTRKDKYRLVDLGSEFLDELYMLIEQIQARQKTPEKSNN